MDVLFTELVFHNKSGADVTVWLESPAGSGNLLVNGERVAGDKDRTFKFEAHNVSTAQIRADSTFGGAKDKQNVEATCSPYPGFLESITAEYFPGNIWGGFRARFLDPSKGG
ncbi:hypothetical protein [Mesorhizobium sophorae]|uniref:hypothetical protein n=1 Tax=Mesorhizobium sophorae TaxID=1300294 RepID=UPI00117D22A0|nr:hypothetical protein [Mesorhizobium sophorae]